ncbi:phosphatidylethanolamine-binding protein [Favolaschia claudopus]|uniref:Phosphatidylethanolamine-binding protein n=1 Tax=Favolaschia claudopus TaxID=2862362 RepID=A0AAW0DIV5_9AGAR
MPLIEPFSNTTSALKKAGLVPEILGDFNASALLTIILPSGSVSLGAEVPISETVAPPGIAIAAVPKDEDISADGLLKNEANQARYTVAMFDPDAPSAANPTSRQFRHWVITGLTANEDPAAPALQTTQAANEYRPPGPPKGSGLHRYKARRRWDAVKFGQQNGLELVGAAFYLVRSEE